MNYNQTKTDGGNVMPLIMGCTQPSKIEVIRNEEPAVYDPLSQTIMYNMQIVGTKSLKNSSTRYQLHPGTPSLSHQYGTKTDKKNEIDDQKSV